MNKKRTQAAERPGRDPVSAAGDAPLAEATAPDTPRVSVAKAYKMFVGGAFVRSESGRYFQVRGAGGGNDPDPETVNVPRGSRKDVRDAVRTAKGALGGWRKRAAFNRGQILYRLGEVMESRRAELVDSLVRSGAAAPAAAAEVDASIDRAIYYAGFADKYFALLASHNPVSGPHFAFSIPDAMGVVGVVAPERPSLLGLVSTVLPVVTGGNTCVALASDADPRTAIVWSECLATSDMPGGVVNILTGHAKELTPHLAKHREVIGLDVWLASAELLEVAQAEGADNVKRVRAQIPLDAEAWLDDTRGQGLSWLERFLETKTVWHPVGV